LFKPLPKDLPGADVKPQPKEYAGEDDVKPKPKECAAA